MKPDETPAPMPTPRMTPATARQLAALARAEHDWRTARHWQRWAAAYEAKRRPAARDARKRAA